MASGANWARITQTVLGGLGAIAIVVQIVLIARGAPGRGTTVPITLDVVALATSLAALGLMYLPRANAYFAGRAPNTPVPQRIRPTRRAPAEVGWAVRLWLFNLGLVVIVDTVSWVVAGQVDRVLLTIFAAAAAVFAVQYLLTLVGGLPEALSLVELAIEVVAVVLLYRAPANAYFRPGAVTTRSN